MRRQEEEGYVPRRKLPERNLDTLDIITQIEQNPVFTLLYDWGEHEDAMDGNWNNGRGDLRAVRIF
jgi:hypothetical protein